MPSGVSGLLHNVEELERALEYPWEKRTVFLHYVACTRARDHLIT
jgi:ATP-dependent exoDNAse (exonuclease V) beta subunit